MFKMTMGRMLRYQVVLFDIGVLVPDKNNLSRIFVGYLRVSDCCILSAREIWSSRRVCFSSKIFLWGKRRDMLL